MITHDVLIIGAGISGLMAALEASKTVDVSNNVADIKALKNHRCAIIITTG